MFDMFIEDYKPISDVQQVAINTLKQKARILYAELSTYEISPHIVNAVTNLEESVAQAIIHIESLGK